MKILLSLLLSITCVLFHAQNLVSNWSFEEYNACPDHVDNIGDCVGWMNFAGSCDYFNGCAGEGGLSTPGNVRGYQSPLDGQTYMGLVGAGLSTPEYREYAAVQLLTDLTIGETYYYSMYVSLADFISDGAIKNLGIKLTNSRIYPNALSTELVATNLEKFSVVEISDMTGVMVIHYEVNQNRRLETIDCSALNPGLYITRIYENSTLMSTYRILKL